MAQTCKIHNNVKILVGITQYGTISYIFKLWDGCFSDVYFTENCGLLKNLLPGDLLFPDRGFTVQESVGLYFAELKIRDWILLEKTRRIDSSKVLHILGNFFSFTVTLIGKYIYLIKTKS